MNCERLSATLAIGLLAATAVLTGTAVAQTVEIVPDLAYKSGAGLTDYETERCRLDLYLPADAGNFPTLVWFHGGNITAGDKGDATHRQIASALAERGIAVAAVNYRLSPQVSFPAYIDDTAASIAWVLDNISQYGGDAGEVFVSGHSAGAYLASMVGLDAQFLARYDHDPDELAGLIPISGQMVTHATVRTERNLPADRPLIDAAAPAFHVSQEAPPFLAIAGSEDLPARAEENAYFVAAMKAVDHADVDYLEFDGRNHGTIVTGIPGDNDPVANAIVRFVERLSD